VREIAPGGVCRGGGALARAWHSPAGLRSTLEAAGRGTAVLSPGPVLVSGCVLAWVREYHPLPSADSFNDLYRFDPATNSWTELSPTGSAPSPRCCMGFAATPDGVLYVIGGMRWSIQSNSNIVIVKRK
jgi:hypothetical protein